MGLLLQILKTIERLCIKVFSQLIEEGEAVTIFYKWLLSSNKDLNQIIILEIIQAPKITIWISPRKPFMPIRNSVSNQKQQWSEFLVYPNFKSMSSRRFRLGKKKENLRRLIKGSQDHSGPEKTSDCFIKGRNRRNRNYCRNSYSMSLGHSTQITCKIS